MASRLDKAMDKMQETTEQYLAQNQCGMSIEPLSLLEQLQREKKEVTNTYNKRMRELNRAISLIENTDAENVIKEVSSILYKL